MGGLVSLSERKNSKRDHSDWFSKQGYCLKIQIQSDSDTLATCNAPIYDIARFSGALPYSDPNTLQCNNAVYDHLAKRKSRESETLSHNITKPTVECR